MADTPDSEPSLVETQPFLVVEKPVGWTLSPGRENSLVDWLENRNQTSSSPLVPLDDDESGLVVFADQDGLEVRARFEALVTPGLNKNGHISKTIQRGSERIEAVTRYELLHDFGLCVHACLEPDLPRSNQVREHLQMIGLSVIGDRRFRGPKFVKVPRFPGRLWLHLARVEIGGRTFESPLPDSLAEHLQHLGA